ncbi:MAG: cation diffusion facilitator family transporter [Clostridiales Family XIII bacterium]|jgi:cation diffusion facilitator family transporter|nr:cation diffusion facilitator family transporter [Clostridiales Family XIII bacterium]
MTNLLEKLFIRNQEGLSSQKLRRAYGMLSGGVGIALNLLLGVFKAILGIITGSMAILADAINNITDAASSVATIIGFRIAAKGSDEEHPFGHARAEYMTGVVVSAMVILVGVKLIETSYDKVMHPTEMQENNLVILFLIIFLFAKLWLYMFNRGLGKKIDSSTLKATAIDSRNDAITTGVVLLSIVIYRTTGLNIDGWVGLAVAVFIIYSGLTLVKETAAPLLGQAPDAETISGIESIIDAYDEVLGWHELVIHDYGPGNVFASVHVEVDAAEDISISHDMIDNIEQEAREQLSINLVVHMDPIDKGNPEVELLRSSLDAALSALDFVVGIHDLRIVKGPTHTNVIFDTMITHGDKAAKGTAVRDLAKRELLKLDPHYKAVVNIDLDYSPER